MKVIYSEQASGRHGDLTEHLTLDIVFGLWQFPKALTMFLLFHRYVSFSWLRFFTCSCSLFNSIRSCSSAC